MSATVRISIVLAVGAVGLGVGWSLRLADEHRTVAHAIDATTRWPMGEDGEPLAALLRQTHALAKDAPLHWNGAMVDRRLGIVRVVVRLTGPDAAELSYAFDVDGRGGHLFAANPRARWLFGRKPPQALSAPTASD